MNKSTKKSLETSNTIVNTEKSLCIERKKYRGLSYSNSIFYACFDIDDAGCFLAPKFGYLRSDIKRCPKLEAELNRYQKLAERICEATVSFVKIGLVEYIKCRLVKNKIKRIEKKYNIKRYSNQEMRLYSYSQNEQAELKK